MKFCDCSMNIISNENSIQSSISTKLSKEIETQSSIISIESYHSIYLSTCNSIILSKSIFDIYSALDDILFLIKLKMMSTAQEETIKRIDDLSVNVLMINEQT